MCDGDQERGDRLHGGAKRKCVTGSKVRPVTSSTRVYDSDSSDVLRCVEMGCDGDGCGWRPLDLRDILTMMVVVIVVFSEAGWGWLIRDCGSWLRCDQAIAFS